MPSPQQAHANWHTLFASLAKLLALLAILGRRFSAAVATI
jgi:hypothetical protein